MRMQFQLQKMYLPVCDFVCSHGKTLFLRDYVYKLT